MCSNTTPAITDNANELIRDLHDNPDIIQPYNAELVAKCAQQINVLYDENVITLTELAAGACRDQERSMTMVRVRQSAIDRIKRCCCTYIVERMNRLRHLRWRSGAVLSDEVKKNLSKEELKWFSKYNEIIFKFQSGFGENGLIIC